ncbi:pilus assembly protein PilM [Bremerella sp. T1]|uniref:pilus assembly protein PilM n=1 Tax=Bremerella sp. TYQ1 TaxID=3119568 RepID=UPI001CCBFE6D|nr:pilus assembly protein PilM [Bremerella volcania]UBM37646.1 pilus assembly protein PilM [Bremerella volcania]
MIRLPFVRYNPIGIDIGSKSIKMVQFTKNYDAIQEAAIVDLPPELSPESDFEGYLHGLGQTLQRSRVGRHFRGNDAIVCVHQRDLFLHNIRVGKSDPKALSNIVHQEAADRIPYSMLDAEIRFIESEDIRQGDQLLREVIIMACFRPRLEALLETIEKSGFRPASVDVEPMAVLRSFTSQYRREADEEDRVLYVHVGYTNTVVIIAQGNQILFVKYIDVGGRHFDEAVSRQLDMSLSDAINLRKHNSDRRRSQQTPEVERSVINAMRDELERLQTELSMCIRYHSVTFRGKPLVRLVLSGGEATESLRGELERVAGLTTELGDPLRIYDCSQNFGRHSQWDVAVGLAARRLGGAK